MKVDLVKDQKKIRRYILQRIQEYAIYENDGPGEDDALIQLVTLGYYLEQTGYFALVFDTRPDANIDGEWTVHINEETTMLHFPKWCSLIDAWYANKPSELVLLDGTSLRVDQKTHTHGSIAQVIGEMLRDTMIQLRDDGSLEPLPLADDAFLSVEEFDDHWGWPQTHKPSEQVKLSRNAPRDHLVDEETDDDRRDALVKRIRKLPVGKQISFWILELNRRAKGKPSELDKTFLESDRPSYGNNCALDELERIGKSSVVPMLDLVRKLSKLSEWERDRPKRRCGETPMKSIAVRAIWKVRDMGHTSDPIEKLLHQIVRTACKTNKERKLWGILPYHAALCLHSLFEGYPEPAWDERTNRLLSPEQFQKSHK